MAEKKTKLIRLGRLFEKGGYFLWWYLRHSPSLEKFAGIHQGEDCFIIGNGPSLNKMNLDQLCDYYTFGLNKIYLLFDRGYFRPSYHVAVNPYVIQQSASEFENLLCPSFLPYMAAKNKVGRAEHINYIFTRGSYLSFNRDLRSLLPEGYTVTYVAMQIAYYMGFENVYLIGVDHNFKVQGQPNELQYLKGEDVNHFAPNYFGNKEWQLPDLEGSERSYRLAKSNFERYGRQIFDATIDGKLDIFPKLSFKEALSTCKKKREL